MQQQQQQQQKQRAATITKLKLHFVLKYQFYIWRAALENKTQKIEQIDETTVKLTDTLQISCKVT